MSGITLAASTAGIMEQVIIKPADSGIFYALTAVFNIWYITRHYYG